MQISLEVCFHVNYEETRPRGIMTSLSSQEMKGRAGWALPHQHVCRAAGLNFLPPQSPPHVGRRNKETADNLHRQKRLTSAGAGQLLPGCQGLSDQRSALLGAKAMAVTSELTRDWLGNCKGTSRLWTSDYTAAGDTSSELEPHRLLQAEDPGRVGRGSSIH